MQLSFFFLLFFLNPTLVGQFIANYIVKGGNMVQEIAQSIIRMASNAEAQDIYFVPRASDYQLFLRVGDERRFV